MLLLTVAALGAPSARAQSIQAGSMEFTLAVGGGASLPRTEPDIHSVTSYHLLPHLGYFVTDEAGRGVLRGNLEILAEPTLIHLEASPPATVAGLAILPRWLFATSSRVRPYLEAGAGIVGGRLRLPQTDCDVNFLLEAGAGVMIFMNDHVALTLAVRMHHISNADLCEDNAGINSVIGTVGLSYFFR